MESDSDDSFSRESLDSSHFTNINSTYTTPEEDNHAEHPDRLNDPYYPLWLEETGFVCEIPTSNDIDERLLDLPTTLPKVTELEDLGVGKQGNMAESRFHCPDCRRSFGAKKDLKRHAHLHDSDSKLWYCGCCQNMNCSWVGKTGKNGRPRKDKVREHLRSKHHGENASGIKAPKTSGIECPKGCAVLLTAASCLHEHYRRKHPDETLIWENPIQTADGPSCQCSQAAELARLQNYQPQTNKHSAGTYLESTAKRGKYDLTQSFNQAIVPTSAPWLDPIAGPSTGLASTDECFQSLPGTEVPSISNFTYSAYSIPLSLSHDWRQEGTAFALSNNVTTQGILPAYDGEAASSYQAASDQYLFQGLIPTNWPSAHLHTVENSRPADYLLIRESEDFQTILRLLRSTNDNHTSALISPPSPLMTYNAKKETITLRGSLSQANIKEAVAILQNLLETFSTRWGMKYLMSSGHENELKTSVPRKGTLDVLCARASTQSETTRTFPIRVKERQRLVRLWFSSMLPALPGILGPILGGSYSASLTLRGRIEMEAQPCVRIESPNIPASAAQQTVKDDVADICKRMSHAPICIEFTRGSLQSLKGGEQHKHDDAEESAECQLRRFNLVRPSSRSFMGASIGLLCSKKISATWGGIVLIEGKKYMLTSDHFVTESQTPANKDSSDSEEVITSPSRYDLWEMERNLKQNMRDLIVQIKKMMQTYYGNCEIDNDRLSDPTFFAPGLRETTKKAEDTMELLHQVTKDSAEYKVGEVVKRSLEPRKANVPRYLAETLQLPNDRNEVTHFMDWSLCSLSSGHFQSDENRHKYRSSEEATVDDYIHEEERSQDIEPGEICSETCDPDSAIAVHYVGQGSEHRRGSINIPMLVCRDSNPTYEWSIMDPDGQDMPYPSVAGDSGAWIIRSQDNKVVGQVQAHINKQVLFTPINVLLADLTQYCGAEASLPPKPDDAAQMVTANPARPLCKNPGTPPIRRYKFLDPRFELPTLVQKCSGRTGMSVIESAVIESAELFIKLSGQVDEQDIQDRRYSDLSSVKESSAPSLTDSPRSSGSFEDLPESPKTFAGNSPSTPVVRSNDVSTSADSAKLGRSLGPKVSFLSLDELTEDEVVTSILADTTSNATSLPKVSPPAQSLSWPIDSSRKVTESKVSKNFQYRPFHDHEMPLGSRWKFTIRAWLAGGTEHGKKSRKKLSKSRRAASNMSIFHDFSNQAELSMLEGCNVAA